MKCPTIERRSYHTSLQDSSLPRRRRAPRPSTARPTGWGRRCRSTATPPPEETQTFKGRLSIRDIISYCKHKPDVRPANLQDQARWAVSGPRSGKKREHWRAHAPSWRHEHRATKRNRHPLRNKKKLSDWSDRTATCFRLQTGALLYFPQPPARRGKLL